MLNACLEGWQFLDDVVKGLDQILNPLEILEIKDVGPLLLRRFEHLDEICEDSRDVVDIRRGIEEPQQLANSIAINAICFCRIEQQLVPYAFLRREPSRFWSVLIEIFSIFCHLCCSLPSKFNLSPLALAEFT